MRTSKVSRRRFVQRKSQRRRKADVERETENIDSSSTLGEASTPLERKELSTLTAPSTLPVRKRVYAIGEGAATLIERKHLIRREAASTLTERKHPVHASDEEAASTGNTHLH